MVQKKKSIGLKVKSLGLLLALALGVAVLVQPKPAEAHCDAVNGPVVTAAEAALAKGDVKLVLPYVKPDAEAELTAAFKQAQEVRKLGGSAGKLAETYFFETSVRLHRAGEGAAYTGLKYESDFGPALEAADKALVSNSITGVSELVDHAVAEGLSAKFRAVQDARKNATRLGTVESQRERAEAELLFEQYVLNLYNAATGLPAHVEGEAAAAHTAATADTASAGHAD